jgi:hypothetical protein
MLMFDRWCNNSGQQRQLFFIETVAKESASCIMRLHVWVTSRTQSHTLAVWELLNKKTKTDVWALVEVVVTTIIRHK